MRENVLDVLMYLFETYIETQDETEMDHEDLGLDLTEAGFNSVEIDIKIIGIMIGRKAEIFFSLFSPSEAL